MWFFAVLDINHSIWGLVSCVILTSTNKTHPRNFTRVCWYIRHFLWHQHAYLFHARDRHWLKTVRFFVMHWYTNVLDGIMRQTCLWTYHQNARMAYCLMMNTDHDDVIKWNFFSALPALCRRNPRVAGGFPSQRPVTRSFDVFFDLSLSKRLSKESRRRWFETPWRPFDASVMRYGNISVAHCLSISDLAYYHGLLYYLLSPSEQSSLKFEKEYNKFYVWKLPWKYCLNTLQGRHNECDGVSSHRRHDCLLNRLFRHRSKKTSKLRVTGLCGGNSPVTNEFPAQRASNTGIVSIRWRHHE